MNKEISIIIPAYNSENSIIELIKLIECELNTYFYNLEIIIVDDCSKDNTFNKIKQLKALNLDIKAIRLKQNVGQQNALLCGIRNAKFSYVATIDDDLQHNPRDIIKLYEALENDYDIVYGLAKLPYDLPFHRNLGSYMRDILFRTLFPYRKNTKVSSLRIMNKKAIDMISKCRTNFVYLSAIVFSNRSINIGNLELDYNHRKYGKSNYSLKKLAKLYLNILVNYSNFPLFKPFKKIDRQYEIQETFYINKTTNMEEVK